MTFEGTISNRTLALNIKVPQYNRLEFLSAMSHYSGRDVISRDISQLDVQAYRMHVNSNPYLARKEAIPFFFPKAVLRDMKTFDLSSMGIGLEPVFEEEQEEEDDEYF